LIGEADGHEESAEDEEAEDAVALAEVAQVVEEGFADGEDEEDERMKADRFQKPAARSAAP
jgi:hypothetical protein